MIAKHLTLELMKYLNGILSKPRLYKR